MNKATELMIDHMIYGALWPKTQYYLQHYGSSSGGGIDLLLDNLYNDITDMINQEFDPSTQPMLIEMVDMFFDEIDWIRRWSRFLEINREKDKGDQDGRKQKNR